MEAAMVEVMPSVSDAVSVVITRRVALPAAEVRARLSAGASELLGAPGESDDLAEGRHAVPLRVRFAGVHFDRIAAVGFAPIVEEDDGTQVLPLWWEAADQPWLFPTFEGGLEVRPGDGGTELRLEGIYRPPLGAAGGLVNRTILNRAATASLESLLERVSERLTRPQRQTC
jgi:hypothetical protein